MAITLELVDEGGVVADFTGSTYNAMQSTLAGLGRSALSSVAGDRRPIVFDLTITGTTVADLEDKIRTLDNTLDQARYRQRTKQGTQILLKMQFGNSNANDIEWQVLGGGLGVPSSSLDAPWVAQFRQVRLGITFICERLAHLATSTLPTAQVQNEVDDPNFNFTDIVWTPTVAGRGGREGLLRIQLAQTGGTAWNGNKKIWIATRSGERYQDVLFYQAPDSVVAGTDPSNTGDLTSSTGTTGGLTTNASGGASATLRWTNSTGANRTLLQPVTNVGYFQFDIAGASLPKGQFRVLARVNIEFTDTSGAAMQIEEFGLALGYVFGGVTKTPGALDNVTVPSSASEDEWNILDLGIINIPPNALPETTYTDPALNLRIYATLDAVSSGQIANTDYLSWELDHIWLFPVDENAVVVSGVGDADEIVIDSFGKPPGVYIVDSGDVVQKFATFTGNPRFTIGPENNIRLMWLRDDVDDPTDINAFISPFTIGRVEGM